MTHLKLLGLLAPLLVWPIHLCWAEQIKPAPFKVLLQGKPGAKLQQLVKINGGLVTHELHIINAVGAMVTRDQLDKIKQSELITRAIDDLSLQDPTEEDEKKCDVGGAVELDFDEFGFSWRLYNKKDTQVQLRSVDISWPSTLGDIVSIALGGKAIDTALPQAKQNGKMSLKFGPSQNLGTYVDKTATLRVAFASPEKIWAGAPPQQADFQVKVGFGGDCTSEMIPGYLANHENSYFPTVIGADALHLHGITGKGVTVAIVDSGLWETDVLGKDSAGNNRILARYDAIKNAAGEEVFDDSGHGTHIASVLAQSDQVTQNGKLTGTFKGVAPDVNLVVVKAFDIEGHGDFLDIVRAIQFVVDHREQFDIKVMNLSFAAKPRWDYWDDPINQAVMRAWASGITVIAAAGNEGPDAMTIGSPGNLPYLITVGAVTDSWTVDSRNDDYIPDFSSRGPTPNGHIKPDIVAPGGHMTGITRMGSTLAKQYPDYLLKTGEFVMTGSSQAAALVSGMVALLLQLEPDLSPDDVKCKLLSSAEPAINSDGLLSYSPFQQGSGYVSVTRAITLGQRGCGNVGLDIQKDMMGQEHFQGPSIILEDGKTSLPGLTEMYLGQPSNKGLSESRKWGVKEHIESKDYDESSQKTASPTPFDWQRAYSDEQARIEKLSR